MSIHRCYKIFEIKSTGHPMNSGECILVDLHSNNKDIPKYFDDLGAAEHWLKSNGGQGVSPKYTIMTLLYWDYE